MDFQKKKVYEQRPPPHLCFLDNTSKQGMVSQTTGLKYCKYHGVCARAWAMRWENRLLYGSFCPWRIFLLRDHDCMCWLIHLALCTLHTLTVFSDGEVIEWYDFLLRRGRARSNLGILSKMRNMPEPSCRILFITNTILTAGNKSHFCEIWTGICYTPWEYSSLSRIHSRLTGPTIHPSVCYWPIHTPVDDCVSRQGLFVSLEISTPAHCAVVITKDCYYGRLSGGGKKSY